MLWKVDPLEMEFLEADPRLQALMLYADWWSGRQFGHELLVTDVGRSQSEYDRIYAAKIAEGLFFIGENGVKHYAGPRPHLADPLHGIRTRAGDFGVQHGGLTGAGRLLMANARRLEEHLSAQFRRSDRKPTALLHNVGSGQHLHVQVEA